VSIWNDTGQTVNTVTYAGQALTFLNAQNNGTNDRVELWYKVGPVTGGNNVVVTLQAGETARIVAGAVSLTGVDQATPIDAVATFATGTSLAPSVVINTTTDNAWVIDTLAAITDVTANAGPGQSARWNYNNTGGPPLTRVRGTGSTEGPRSPAGAVTMSWALESVQPWVIGAVALRPAGGVVGIDWREIVQ
jgi:hypothetical protein